MSLRFPRGLVFFVVSVKARYFIRIQLSAPYFSSPIAASKSSSRRIDTKRGAEKQSNFTQRWIARIHEG